MLKTTLTAATILAMSSLAHADLYQRGLDALAFAEGNLRVADALYAEHCTLDGKRVGPSTIWAGGVQLSALNAAAKLDSERIPAARAYAEALDAYRWQKPGQPLAYQPFPVGAGVGDLYYDDNAWLVLAFLDTRKLTGDDAFLRRAREAFEYLASGESPELGGGIWWSDTRQQKNTCSVAPSICAALALHEVTKEPKLVELADRLYAWMPRLQDADGLYFDNLNVNGNIDRTKWSYNSALMIRANLMLHRVKGEARYLAEANRIADAADAKWFRESDGALTDEGSFAHLLCECLLELHEASPRSQTVARVLRSLDKLTTLARNDGYPKRWDGWRANEKRVELLQQASAARAFLIATPYAAAATTRPAR